MKKSVTVEMTATNKVDQSIITPSLTVRVFQEHARKQIRIESKTGFRPLTDALHMAYDDPDWHYYSNENNLIYRIVLGMSASQYKSHFGVKTVRDNVLSYELAEITRLQTIDTGLISIGLNYQKRKQKLIECHNQIKAVA